MGSFFPGGLAEGYPGTQCKSLGTWALSSLILHRLGPMVSVAGGKVQSELCLPAGEPGPNNRILVVLGIWVMGLDPKWSWASTWSRS